jgi:PAS domain S-box-containing protein
MFDDKMRYLAVSRRFVADFRLPPDIELIGRWHYDVLPDVPPRWREVHARVLAGEELAHDEDPFVRQDRRTDWCRWLMKPWYTAAGRIGGAMLFSEVITEKVEARRALADSEARFRAIFENAAVGIAHAAPDGRWLRVNKALCRIVGQPADELLTKTFEDITHPDDLAAEVAQLELARERKIDSYVVDKRYPRKDDATVWVRKTVGCVRKDDGSIDYFVSVMEDISARKHAEELLRRQADLLNQSHDAILTMQTEGRGIVYWSRGAERLYGYTATEAEGRRAHDLLQTRASIPIEDMNAQIIHEGSWDGELTHTTRDGREIVVESSIVRVSYDGEIFALETNRDITERKRHEESEHLIMREMSHRAKNMLGLVQAIARQTATRNPEDFIERFSERIKALAANQDLLTRNEWKGVDLEELVRAQLAHFADIVGSRIVVHGQKLHLNAGAAQAIGLALHELATNAGKYGALSLDAGSVDVGWQLDGDVFAMNWTERNGPPVSPPERRGFGSTVVDVMAKRTVGGEVELDYAPSGLAWRLTCPAANALEPREREQNIRGRGNQIDRAAGEAELLTTD